MLIGQEVPEASLALARAKMKEYNLGDTKLTVMQGSNNETLDIGSLRAMVMEDFYKKSEERLQEQKQQIATLTSDLEQYHRFDALSVTLAPELKVLYPEVKSIALSHAIEQQVDSLHADTLTFAIVQLSRQSKPAERAKMTQWLKARLGTDRLRLIVETR